MRAEEAPLPWTRRFKVTTKHLIVDSHVESGLPEKGAPPLFIAMRNGAFVDKGTFLDWLRRNQTKLDELLLVHGAIVLRGFPLATAEDFDDFAAVFPPFSAGYVGGGAPRAAVAGRVLEATRAAKELFLCLHQEMAYLSYYPDRVAFFCRTPAESGGETIIGDMRAFTRRLPAQIRERLEKHGVRAVRNFAPAEQGRGEVADARDGIAWDESFGTGDRQEVEALCAARGLEPLWKDDGGLAVITHLDPFSTHPVTGDRLYRSIIHTSNINTVTGELTHKMEGPLATGYTYGDGTAMTIAEGQAMHDILNDITACWPWQAGDVLLLDNLLTAHGRNRYTGTRETLAALLTR